jgi:HEAT repeat protein
LFAGFAGVCRILLSKENNLKRAIVRTMRVRVAVSCLLPCVVLTFSLFGETPSARVDRARAVLRDGFEAGDFTVRIQAIQAAGLVGPSEMLRTELEKFLADGNVGVRVAAVKTIGDLKLSASLPALRKCLTDDKTPEVRFAAAKALFGMHDKAGMTWLIEVYDGKEKGQSNALQSQTRKFMGNFHSLESAGTFVVTSGIGYVPVPGVGEGFSAVTGLLSDPELTPRAASLILLSRDKDEQVDGLLREALSDKDWSVRASATQMIAYTARTNLREQLVPLFEDKSVKVKFRAAGAYLHLALFPKPEGAPTAIKLQ